MATKISYCRNCAANCGVKLNIEDNKITSIEADRSHPLSKGYVCIKGTMASDLINGKEKRLTQAVQKTADGSWKSIDKHQAVKNIANQLDGIIKQHGPRALGCYWGTYSYFDCIGKTLLKNVMSALGSPAIFSSMTLDQSSKWVTAARMGVWAGGKPVSTETDVILIAGCNPPVSHQGYPMVPYPTTNTSRHIQEAKKRGAKLIVIDPRQTELARRADLFIQPKPGHDAFIAAALVREILNSDKYQHSFCDRWTTNLDALREAVSPFALETVAHQADIDARDLLQAIDWLLEAKKPGIGTGTGVDMSRYSNTAEHLFEALSALVGAYVTEGDRIPNPGVMFARPEQETVVPPNRTWERPPFCGSDQNFGKLMGEFPSSLLPDEILHEGPNKIRALIVVGGNPAMALGDPEKTAKALADLELLVVIDPRLDSATAQYADYVLAPTLQFEREELTSFTEFAFHEPFIQYSDTALQPPPQTIGEDEFAWQLAKHLNIDLHFKYLPFGASYEDIPESIALNMEEYCGRRPLIEWMLKRTDIRLEELIKNPQGIVKESQKRLKAAESDSGARLDLCPQDVQQEIHQLSELLNSDQQAPFLLYTRRLTESYNSSFLDSSITRKRYEKNYLNISEADMTLLQLQEDELVTIQSTYGEILGHVKADKSVRAGTVNMAHCWGQHNAPQGYSSQGSHTGQLVSLDKELQSINRMPLQTGIPVHIYRADQTNRQT